MPKEEWKRKRQKQPVRRPKEDCEHLPGPSKAIPKTSARPIKKPRRENLTLSDWMTVYAYVDTLPQPINQGGVVKYFATRPEGALVFSQPTLSRKLLHCAEMEACELLDPEEEREIGQSLDVFEGGDLEIVRMVQAKVGSARGDIIEINSDSDDSEPEAVPSSLKEMIEACRMLEDNTLRFCTEDALDFVQAARQYRAHFQRMSREVPKQTTLDSFFNYK